MSLKRKNRSLESSTVNSQLLLKRLGSYGLWERQQSRHTGTWQGSARQTMAWPHLESFCVRTSFNPAPRAETESVSPLALALFIFVFSILNFSSACTHTHNTHTYTHTSMPLLLHSWNLESSSHWHAIFPFFMQTPQRSTSQCPSRLVCLLSVPLTLMQSPWEQGCGLIQSCMPSAWKGLSHNRWSLNNCLAMKWNIYFLLELLFNVFPVKVVCLGF